MHAPASPTAKMVDGPTAPICKDDLQKKPGAIAVSLKRLRHALRPAVVFAPCYAIAVCGAVACHFLWREQSFTTRIGAVLILFALGALIAGFVSWLFAAMIAGSRPTSARFAAMTVFLIIATAGFTAFLFFLQFRVYYAQFHSAELTKMWLVQLMFTGASAVYIFLSSGLRMLLPFGLPVLFGAAYIFARRPRV